MRLVIGDAEISANFELSISLSTLASSEDDESSLICPYPRPDEQHITVLSYSLSPAESSGYLHNEAFVSFSWISQRQQLHHFAGPWSMHHARTSFSLKKKE